MNRISLGEATEYPQEYAPGVLFPVARDESRQVLGLPAALPFSGADLWTAWELTWLDQSGKPVVAVATLTIDAASPAIIESKSLKLYLNSLAMTRFSTPDEVGELMQKDLSAVAGAMVLVDIHPGTADAVAGPGALPGTCIDNAALASPSYQVDAALLEVKDNDVVTEELHSHLFRSLCPVTGQPDYASLLVRYTGPRIDRRSLLAYFISFRQHNDFHEACVERMFRDLQARCATSQLTIYARFTRRGGIDINPFRSDFEKAPANARVWRQ